MNKIYNPFLTYFHNLFRVALFEIIIMIIRKNDFRLSKARNMATFGFIFLQMLKSTVVVYDAVVRFKPSQGWVFPYG